MEAVVRDNASCPVLGLLRDAESGWGWRGRSGLEELERALPPTPIPGREPGFPRSNCSRAWARRVRALVHTGLCYFSVLLI